jgi:hypothetical protein
MKHVALLIALGLEAFILCAPPVYSGDTQSHRWSTETASSTVTGAKPLREMPAEQYSQLSAEAMRKAHVHAGPIVANPRLGKTLFDPAILRTLEQQRNFLLARQSLVLSPDAGTRQGGSAKLMNSDLRQSPCAFAVIRSVNGVRKGAVFTPKAPDNHYTIEGCSFGDQPGQVLLKLDSDAVGDVPKLLDLQLGKNPVWSAREIDVQLDSDTSGLNDYAGKTTLQVITAKKQLLELPGCSFVALRSDPQLLTLIPSSWVRLQPTLTRAHPLRKLEYVSPALRAGDVPDAAIGTSAMVIRSDSQRFPSGRDTFDFSHLLNGWVVEKVEPLTYTVSCPGIRTGGESNGRWNLQWNETSVTYTWRADYCTSFVPPYFGFNMSSSPYALKVWVRGPLGTPFLPTDIQQIP